MIGKIIDGKYELVRLLGEGGMGSVFEAEHTRISRKVAVKVMHGDTRSEPDAMERFLREAESASAIGHPNIIEIFDVGVEDDGTAFIVMEMLEGVSLDVVLDQRGALPPSRAVAIVLQILSALHAAHRKGIIHRDLKPENVFMAVDSRNREEVKLLDFGVAKVTEATEDDLHLTKTGTVLGTPSYLSPEQARGRKDIDARIDIWAAGVLLYRMVAGELPFKGENYNEVLANILIEEPRPLPALSRDVPEGLVAAVASAMAKNREERFQSVAEMIEALLPFCDRAENEMTPQAFQVLRESVPPPPPLPRVEPHSGKPAIPQPSDSPGAGESGEAPPAGELEPERQRRFDEITLDEPTSLPTSEASLSDSVGRTIKRAPRKALVLSRRATLTALAVAGGGAALLLIALAFFRDGEPGGVEVTTLAPEVSSPPAVEEGEGSGSSSEPAREPGPETAVEGQWPEAAQDRAALSPSGAKAVSPEATPATATPPSEATAPVAAAPAAANLPRGSEAPDLVVIEIKGAPGNAVVSLAGQRMSPPLEIPRSGRLKMLTVAAPGYLAFRKFVRPDRDQVVSVKMEKAPITRAGKSGAKSSAAKKEKERAGKLLSNPFK